MSSDRNTEDTELIGAAIATTVAKVTAPDRLRARVAGVEPAAPVLAWRDQAGRSIDRGRRGRWAIRPRRMAAAGLVTGVAALAVTAGPIDFTGDPARPTDVADAAIVALRPPSQPPPAANGDDDRYLRAEIGGVRFPNYGYESRWRAIGARPGGISGRNALTLVYGAGTSRVGYTIVAGPPLAVPATARRMTFGGQRLAILRSGGATIVTWRRDGQTCVLAARDLPLRTLLRFTTPA